MPQCLGSMHINPVCFRNYILHKLCTTSKICIFLCGEITQANFKFKREEKCCVISVLTSNAYAYAYAAYEIMSFSGSTTRGSNFYTQINQSLKQKCWLGLPVYGEDKTLVLFYYCYSNSHFFVVFYPFAFVDLYFM